MKKGLFIKYILFLVSALFALLIVWPDTWVNIDIDDFHYHKLWKGPKLSDITGGLFENELDFELGKEFIGNSEYKLKVAFPGTEISFPQNQDGEVKPLGENLQLGESPFETTLDAQEGQVNLEADKELLVDETVELLRKRLDMAGLVEATVWASKQNGEYFVHIRTGLPKEKSEKYHETLFAKGLLEIWYPRQEQDIEQVPTQTGNTIRDMLSQSYQNAGVNFDQIKGFRIGEQEESDYIKIGLFEEQSVEITNVLYLSQSQLIALLDDRYLLVDSRALSEQLSFYGQVKSVKLAGVSDLTDAKVVGATVSTGPLPVSLEQLEATFADAIITSDSLQKAAIFLICFAVVTAILLAFYFKADGLVATFSFGYYLLLFVAALKLVPFKITIASFSTILLSVSIFLSLVVYYLKGAVGVRGKSKDLSVNFVTSKTFSKLTKNITIVASVVSFAAIFFAPWEIKNISWVLLAGTIVLVLVDEFYFPFKYKFLSQLKSD